MTSSESSASSGAHQGPTAGAAAFSGGTPSRDPQKEDASFNDADAFTDAHFALELGKEWVRQHQTTAMLGAFAVGAFIGALMRD